MKKIISVIFTLALVGSLGAVSFANESNPQTLVDENVYEVNGSITHEYIWKDSSSISLMSKSTRNYVTLNSEGTSESDQLGYATWLKSSQPAGELRHRAAKISPNAGSSAWYACSQTDYAAWHYSRCRIVKTVGGKILEDSNQVQVDSGIATARTPEDSLYLLDWDFSMRSYWGI